MRHRYFLSHCELTRRHDLCDIISPHRDIDHFLHGSCRRILAYKALVCEKLNVTANEASSRLRRSFTGSFCYKDMCFLCGEDVGCCKDVRKVSAGEEFDNKLTCCNK